MEYQEIGERFEFNGVTLEVVEKTTGIGCMHCYLCIEKICKLGMRTYCDLTQRKDKTSIIFKLVEQCKQKNMEQKEEIKVQGTDKTFATQATNSLKIEDLKNGDFVAFDYNGNTAVT